MSNHPNLHFFGTAKVGTKGQIVIPKEAREKFKISSGDQVLIVGEIGRGLGLLKVDTNNELIAKLISQIIIGEKMSDEVHQNLHETIDK